MSAAPHTLIAGAGLAGSLMAVYLARRGHTVTVIERRPDLRTADIPAGRSINLALSARGLAALRGVGLDAQVLAFALPMRGRMMHDRAGALTFQAYGRDGEAIQSVSRRHLNELLLSEAEAAGATIHFETSVTDLDVEASRVGIAQAGEERHHDADLIIGADGAFSALRWKLQKRQRFDFAQTYIEHGYKELTIPPAEDGGFRLDPEALHIWPREDFMLIALPNPDHTFTVTLFLAWEGETSFEALATPADVRAFFERELADVIPHLPHLEQEFFDNPTGSLVYTSCKPHYVAPSTVLIGDAAHAIVPFYGQGMNAAFEDCLLLDQALAEAGSIADAIRAYGEARKENADAIRDLALYNFIVMRSRVADPAFLERRRLETTIEQAFGETYRSLYGSVTFSTMPYAEAKRQAEAQTAFLDEDAASGAHAAAGLLALAHVRRLVG